MPPAALITGAAKRVGRHIALALARKGFDIALHYNVSVGEASSAADEIRAAGRRCELFQADLLDPAQLGALMDRVHDKLPNCRVLVNNASIFDRCDFLETDAGLLDRNLGVHLRAPFVLTQQFARLGEGLVVNLLDTKIARPAEHYFAYALSKRALRDFTLMAARALAPRVRVNGVCPGMMLEPEGADPHYLDRLSKAVPLRRRGRPGHVAAAVEFFIDNDYVTGQVLFVDGGEHLGDDIRATE